MEVDIEAIIGIIMSDEKLVDYVNSLVRNKLSNSSSRTSSMNKRANIVNLIDVSIDEAFDEIKLLDLVREIKSQVIRKNRVQNRSKQRQNQPTNIGHDSHDSKRVFNGTATVQNGKAQSSYSNTKLSASDLRDVDDGTSKILPIFSASEPIPIPSTTPKRIVKNMNQTTSMIHSGLSLQKSRFLKEPDSILSDEVTISNHIKHSSVLADSAEVDSENCSVEITGKPTSYSSYLVSSISDESDKKETPLSFLNSFHAEEQKKVRESVDQSIDSLDLKRFSSTLAESSSAAAALAAAASNESSSAVNQLSSDFRSLVSSTELDGDLDFDVEPVSIVDIQREELKNLKSWEETVSSNLAKDGSNGEGEGEGDGTVEVDVEVGTDKGATAAADSQSKAIDPRHIPAHKVEVEPQGDNDKETNKELLINNLVANESKPVKSILSKVSKVKHLDEDGTDDVSQWNAERHVRVNFIAGCVAEVNFRDKVSYDERPTLFYTHDEEFQFSVDIGREQERADEMGMTWMEWIEQRTDEDVQRDDEADKMRSRRREDDDGISPEDQDQYDDEYNNFEDSFGGDADNNNNHHYNNYSSSSSSSSNFHPSETLRSKLLMSDDFQVEYDDEIDDNDYNNNNNNNNSSHNNSFRNSHSSRVGDPKAGDSRYTLDESYREDFEFDTEDNNMLGIPEDDDF